MNNRRSELKSQQIFPKRLFWIYFGVLLLMSGIHTGLNVLTKQQNWPMILQIILPVLYWCLVAAGLTVLTKRVSQKTYEMPMKMLAEAAKKVAAGDFSIYIPTVHSCDRYDYLDCMILDFNKMVEELGSIETLKTDFFTNVSHEMKAPLAVISTNAELLSRSGTNEQRRVDCIEAILSASRRMNSLITNMLKLNKLEKQVIQPNPESYDIVEQLTECVFQYEELLDQHDLELETDLPDHMTAKADRELMMLVWTNLVSNAIKFTPNGGTLTIAAKTCSNTVHVSIRDTGCGMTAETQQHIFEKFYQGDTSHTTAGNGLGLALVKRILELSDGTVTVESELGKGSVFTVVIPGNEGAENL